MAKYPFLPMYRNWVQHELKYLDQTFEFMDNIFKHETFIDEYHSDEMDVNVFFNCCVILKWIGDKYLIKKYVKNFCKRLEVFIKHENNRDLFNFMNINYKINTDGEMTMTVPEYLKFKSGISEQHVLLQSQKQVKNGIVIIERKIFAYVCRRKLESLLIDRILTKMKEIPLDELMPTKYFTDIDIMRDRYGLKLLNNNYNDGPQQLSTLLPPCIDNIIQKSKDTHDLNHAQRLLLAMFLLRKGYELEYVAAFYENLTDYDEKKTKKHLKSLIGYRVANCEKIKNDGLCYEHNDKTGRCKNIKTPLFF